MKKELVLAIITLLVVFIVSASIFGSIFNFTFIDALKSTTIMCMTVFISIVSSVLVYVEMEDYYLQTNY